MIVFSNKEIFKKKKQKIVSDGIQNLHIVIDFDNTITHSQSLTSHRTIETSELLSKKFRDETKKLFQHYYPIEINYDLSYFTRLQNIIEWWEKSHTLILAEEMTKEKIQSIVDARIEEIIVKDGLTQLFDFCNTNSIPILVLSAGLGDIIRASFKNLGLNHKNVHVISNFLDFEEPTGGPNGPKGSKGGIARRFKGKCIHVYNKNESPILDSVYAENIKHRKNVFVIGDSIGDANMADGLDNECVVKFAYLDGNTKDYVEKYKEKFDVVFVENENFGFILEYLKKMVS